MTVAPEHIAELYELAGAQCEGTLTAERAARLEELALGDAQLRRLYVLYMHIHACAEKSGRQYTEGEKRGPSTSVPSEAGSEQLTVGGRDKEPVGTAVELPFRPGTEIPGPEPLVTPIILDLSPASHYPLATSHSFVGGPVFSYMVSAVILGMMLLGAWAYKITHYHQIAEAPSPAGQSGDRSALVFVGRITGMKDCRWSDPQTEAYAGSSVPLGRKYALASGLMEITYKTGAKVILQGPCTYEVESRRGGYLALGKLTAKVASGQWSVASAKPQAANLQISKSTNQQISKSPNLQIPKFAVRTPTAIVTDLGTEFGMEVSEEGNTTSHVFRGSVRVQVVSADGQQREVVLHKDESARVEKGKKGDETRIVTGGEVGAPPKFVRRLYEPPKLIDLLDIVAGGNGTGNRRERGINPTNGVLDPVFVTGTRGGDRFYWPVVWSRFIDGVFVPDGRAGKVQLNSAGHAFDGFPPTHGLASFSIWARAEEVKPEDRAKDRLHWIYSIRGAEKYMPDGRGLLCIHSDAGLTFDLESMRRAYPGVVPDRFRAVAGMADRAPLPSGSNDYWAADLWVFVNGRLMLKRERIHIRDGTIDVDVELGPRDRFLTLAVTDGGDRNRAGDTMVFGDPVLLMEATMPEIPDESTNQEKQVPQTKPENRKEDHKIGR